MWRLTGAQYARAIREVTGSRYGEGGSATAAMGALDGAPGDVYSNVAAIAGMDHPTLEAVVTGATLEAQKWVATGYKTSKVTCIRATTSVSNTCVQEFVRERLPTVFRRPATTEEIDAYVRRLSPIAQSKGGEEAARLGMILMLSSPEFLFRSEMGTLTAQGSHRLTPWEVGNAIAFTLTNGPPDPDLDRAIIENKLSTPAEIGAQVERLLAAANNTDESFAMRFFKEMTNFTNVLNVMKAPNSGAGDNQRPIDATEERLRDLMSKPSFLDNWLLGLKGSAPDQAGFLTERSFLWAYSQPASTDPIRRGKFISTKLLCNQLPSIELADIPDFNPSPNATMRQQLAQHNTQASCVQCHKMLDAIGLGLERFDDAGRWRDTEQGAPVNTTGVLLGSGSEDGPFNGPVELSEKLARSTRLKQCFVRQAFRYTSGRNESTQDACSLTAAYSAFAQQGRLFDLFKAYFTSDSFLNRR
jgi:hypothetical protein